jgi:hypothetical protein
VINTFNSFGNASHQNISDSCDQLHIVVNACLINYALLMAATTSASLATVHCAVTQNSRGYGGCNTYQIGRLTGIVHGLNKQQYTNS